MEGKTIGLGYKNDGIGRMISLESLLAHLELFKINYHCTVTSYRSAIEDGLSVMTAHKAFIVCQITSEADERIVMEAKEKLL